MRNFREHKTAVFLIAATLAVAVLIGVFAAFSARDRAGAAENLVGAAAEPGQTAASGVGGWIQGIFSYFGSVKSLRAENEALKQENVALDKQVRDTEGLTQENQELRAMLNLMKTESKLDLVAAQVIAKDPSNWYSSFTINKGSNDGILKNQPVLTANKELIGQVYKVGSNWAEIITILDPDSGVGSMIERSKDLGVVEGDTALLQQGLCRIGYLARDTDIKIGDYIETSGMGGVYPKGLLIGTVLEIGEDHTNMSKYATVQPAVSIGKLSQVCVLTGFTEEIKRDEPSATGTEDDTKSKDDGTEDRSESTSSAGKSGTSGSSNSGSSSSSGSGTKSEATAKPKSSADTAKSSGSKSSSGQTGTGSSSGGSNGGSSSSSNNSSSSSSNSSGSGTASKSMNGSELSD